MEIISRAGWGALPPKRALSRWDPSKLLGVTVHWFGTPSSYSDHRRCPELLRSVQRSHQAGEFLDIAYNHAVCPHGAVYELRGFDHQTGANGTTYSNLNYAAVVVMVGKNDPASVFTPAVRAALVWILRRWFARGTSERVVRHGYWTGSACPGPYIGDWVNAGGWKAAPAPPPTTEEDEMTKARVLELEKAAIKFRETGEGPGKLTEAENAAYYGFLRQFNQGVNEAAPEVSSLRAKIAAAQSALA